jgi:calcineurin-like phosphoesterase family protein
MKFRDDIDPATTWVVSDTHFGHDNIVGFCHRPLDHDQVMIAEWRKYVPDDATLLCLGDLAYKGNAHFKHIIAPELTGANKKIILGNHDRQRPSFYKACGFQVCRPFMIRYGDAPDCKVCNGKGWELTLHGERCCHDCTGTGLESPPYVISFSHYPWSDREEGRRMGFYDVRIHGHIHNNGYSRDAFVPFLKQHINISVEQTKYRPVNLKLLLDAYLFGEYPETTDEQLQEARDRKAEAKTRGEQT